MDGIPPLLLIHPVGVGLNHHFWNRFIEHWGQRSAVLAPDLLGCAAGSVQPRPLTPHQWAEALRSELRSLQSPAVVVVQGGSLPIALELLRLEPEACAGLVMVGPPGWRVMGEPAKRWLQLLLWRGLFQGLSGRLFWRWARREAFLRSFSIKELFASPTAVDQEWIAMLRRESADPVTRWAVFAFLAGFWRGNYHQQLQSIGIPSLALFGDQASGISRSGRTDTTEQKQQQYGAAIPGLSTAVIPGRNVLPYESAHDCVSAIHRWVQQLPIPAGR